MEEGGFDGLRFGLLGAVIKGDVMESGENAEDLVDACVDGRIDGRRLGLRSKATVSGSSAVGGRRRRLRR